MMFKYLHITNLLASDRVPGLREERIQPTTAGKLLEERS